MAKVSRPVVYSVVAAAAIYAVVLLTEPEQPVRKPAKRSTLGAAAKAPAGFLPEDLTAQFGRYAGKSRNAFQPEVLPKQTVMSALPPGRSSAGTISGPGLRGTWALTGINVLNGRRSALVENSTTGDSEFLAAGDSWNGLQVVAVETDTVVFLNSLGQRTQLKFVDPQDAAATTGTPPGTVSTTPATTGAPAAPSRTVITVTPINKNGITISSGGVAPIVPPLPGIPEESVSPTRERRQRRARQ